MLDKRVNINNRIGYRMGKKYDSYYLFGKKAVDSYPRGGYDKHKVYINQRVDVSEEDVEKYSLVPNPNFGKLPGEEFNLMGLMTHEQIVDLLNRSTLNTIVEVNEMDQLFDVEIMNEIIEHYKERFAKEIWPDEDYKWMAVKCFQDNWNIDDPDFSNMLEQSLKETDNLLTSVNRFPKGMIIEFAKLYPEEVRQSFRNLFDESQDVFDRISMFISKAEDFLQRWSKEYNKTGKSHYQDYNSVTTYLWLRYPDKYYIYKWSVVNNVAKKIGSKYVFKKGRNNENIQHFFELYNGIREEIQKDESMNSLLNECLRDDCYADPYLNTMTIDLGFFICKRYFNHVETEGEIYGVDYESGLTVDNWIELLNNNQVFTENALRIVACFKDYGGNATCSQIAAKYGRKAGFYNIGSTKLAKRIIKYTGCPVPRNSDGTESFWPVLYTGRCAKKGEDGAFAWNLRPEISSALDCIDLSKVNLYAGPNEIEVEDSDGSFWWLVANPNIWSYSEIGVGECEDFTLYNENGNKRRVFQNYLDAEIGDTVICYESDPIKQVVALAEIAQAQDGERILIKKIENLENPIDFQELRDYEELSDMEFFVNTRGTLFKVSSEEFSFIMDLIRERNPSVKKDDYESYSASDFLKDVFMSKDKYLNLVSVLRIKKNIILQGAPGVGKTFAAKRLAYSMMGVKDDSRVEFVQFHQNYSYEDFVMGYKPTETGFELRNGIFYKFCQKASNQPDKEFFFIIDEINRGNMSKIFGELLMLIEKDYRGEKATLAYNGMAFSVPSNLYIIGMMNTADRSLAMIDYALRRRFSFFEMSPGFETEGFMGYQNRIGNDTFNEVIMKICDLNKEIASDKALGKGFCIGHSYFCNIDYCDDEVLKSIIMYEIIPMLEEYWFDDETKLRRWSSALLGVFNE